MVGPKHPFWITLYCFWGLYAILVFLIICICCQASHRKRMRGHPVGIAAEVSGRGIAPLKVPIKNFGPDGASEASRQKALDISAKASDSRSGSGLVKINPVQGGVYSAYSTKGTFLGSGQYPTRGVYSRPPGSQRPIQGYTPRARMQGRSPYQQPSPYSRGVGGYPIQRSHFEQRQAQPSQPPSPACPYPTNLPPQLSEMRMYRESEESQGSELDRISSKSSGKIPPKDPNADQTPASKTKHPKASARKTAPNKEDPDGSETVSLERNPVNILIAVPVEPAGVTGNAGAGKMQNIDEATSASENRDVRGRKPKGEQKGRENRTVGEKKTKGVPYPEAPAGMPMPSPET